MDLKFVLEEAKFYIMNRRYDEAERILKNALKENPYNEDILMNLGLVYELKSETDKALEIYRRILEFSQSEEMRNKALARIKKLESDL